MAGSNLAGSMDVCVWSLCREHTDFCYGPITCPGESYQAWVSHCNWSSATITLYTFDGLRENVRLEKKYTLLTTNNMNGIKFTNLTTGAWPRTIRNFACDLGKPQHIQLMNEYCWSKLRVSNVTNMKLTTHDQDTVLQTPNNRSAQVIPICPHIVLTEAV